MLRLIVTDPSGQRRFDSERTEILIGRRDGADLLLSDERACSRNHCLVRVEGGRVRVLDLGSVNGTKHGGRRVTEALLAPGDEFAIGGTTIRVVDFLGARPVLEDSPTAGAAGTHATAAPVPRGHHEDFGREVRRMMAKTPWYFTSLAVHIVALLIADLLTFHVRLDEQAVHMVSVAEEEMPDAEVSDNTDIDLKDIEPELDDEEIEVDEPVSAAVRKDPMRTSDIEYDDIVAPTVTGLKSGARIKLTKPLPVSKTKGGDEALNKGDLQGDHGRARDAVARDLGEGLRKARRKLGRQHLVVVRGDFDKIEKILDQYDWPYTLIDRNELVQKRFDSAKLLFINCARKPSKHLAKKLVSKVKRFVQRGGWLITSDWSVEPYLTDGFAGYVVRAKESHRQPDTTIPVSPVSNDPLLKGVFPPRGQAVWWLEETSYMVRATNRVHLLILSEQMKKRFGSDVVAFKFNYGRGKVIHVVGHFYQKDGNRRGLIGMHRLINNVILERVNPTN